MSYFKYVIIENINNNFYKLLVNCTDGTNYTPLDYILPENFEAFVILNQLIEIFCKIRQNNTIDNIVLTRIIDNLITSKCVQFTNLPNVINQGSNTNMFKNSFIIYIEGQVNDYLNEFSNFMQF